MKKMKMHWIFWVVLAIALIAALIFMIPKSSNGNGNTSECKIDSDCVQASCCHATSCVAKENAPNCEDTMCTMECKPNTLDCGGSCVCNEGKCGAVLA